MQIVLTKAEFANLIRSCERYSCENCPFNIFCKTDNSITDDSKTNKESIEDLCIIKDGIDFVNPINPVNPFSGPYCYRADNSK